MSKNRTGLYAALAVAGAGGYYLYRSGGDPEGAKEAMKCTCSFCEKNSLALLPIGGRGWMWNAI